MRIIGGQAKGRQLRAPKGTGTRPTSDRVREAMFSMIIARRDLAGSEVLDLFAGSGALSLEALSRGAERAVLVDQAAEAAQAIEQNVARLGYASRCALVRSSVDRALTRLTQQERLFDLAFVDPPYASDPWPLLAVLSSLVRAGGLVVVEHAATQIPPQQHELYELLVNRRYGDTGVAVFELRQGHASEYALEDTEEDTEAG